MSAPTIAVVVALLALYAAAALLVWRREGRRLPDRDRILTASREPTTHDTDPDGLRFVQDLEAHLKAYGATVADYYDTTPGGPQ